MITSVNFAAKTVLFVVAIISVLFPEQIAIKANGYADQTNPEAYGAYTDNAL